MQCSLNSEGVWYHLVKKKTNITMTYAFLIVVSVAITVKLIFLSFSLYYTVKSSEAQEKKVRELLRFVSKIRVQRSAWPPPIMTIIYYTMYYDGQR